MNEVRLDRVPCNSLWIGERLGPVERACLRSIMAHGHPMVLWCYDRLAGIPDGVVVRDAAEILPQEAIIRHRRGSVALFANRFRYELQRRGIGLWVDTDVYLLKPLDNLPEQVFGWGFFDEIYNGVLRLRSDSLLIPPLLDVFEEDKVPPWLPWRARVAAHWGLKRTGRSGLSQMPWGSAGPMAFTALARRHGLDRLALPSEIFYPTHWRDAAWILDPLIALEDVVQPSSLALHLWNEMIKGFKNDPAPAGSFLARLHQEGAE